MKIKYYNSKVEKQCTSMKAARKLFGGNELLARSLHARINSLQSAECIKDIIVQPTFHFHKLQGIDEGFFAIDVKTRRDPWRLILQPLKEMEEVYKICKIDEIADTVKIVGVREVSKHYE
nr:hypothetical protein [uncultured Blautia sp.]